MRAARILVAVLIAYAVFQLGVATATAARPPAVTWAFCGVHPDDPLAQVKTINLARYGGIDATFGPCMPPDWSTYSPANPGKRYVDPQTYARLTVINANAGMQTVVYDARVWSDDPTVRAEAMAFWAGFQPWIRAFDMGDEFAPGTADWQTLIHRWNNVLTYITPVMGLGPFTNHLPWAMSQALIDLPGAGAHLSFDDYNVGQATWLADYYDSKVNHLMCSVDTMGTTYNSVRYAMRALRSNGCDSFLIFGGVQPYDDPSWGTSLVRYNGTPTTLATAVRYGAA